VNITIHTLQLQKLSLRFDGDDDHLLPAVVAEVRAHSSLKELNLCCLHGDIGLDDRYVELVLEAASALGLTSLDLDSCKVTPAVAPALARLLSSTTLTRLKIFYNGAALLDATAAALLSVALRANCTLRELGLHMIGLWDDADSAAVLLDALVGHASLRELSISQNEVATDADREVAGALLGALVAANAPVLVKLSLDICKLRDYGMLPLVAALPQNTHLRELRIVQANLSADFTEQQLLHAIRANTSLRYLDAGDILDVDDEPPPPDAEDALRLAREAADLVKARAAAEPASE
jgi:hypothetical protein